VATVGAAGLSAVLLVMVPVMGWGLTGIWGAIAVLIAVRGAAFVARFSRKSSIG
jgi:Na+-driven multidrug efflux pump